MSIIRGKESTEEAGLSQSGHVEWRFTCVLVVNVRSEKVDMISNIII